MPKSAIRIATALALVAAISVVAISLLMSGAGNATAFNSGAPAAPPAPPPAAPPVPPTPPAPPAIPAQYTEQCSNGTAVPNPASNPGLVADCAALLASESTLIGAGLRSGGTSFWSANWAISDWRGVTLENNRVTRLNLDWSGGDGMSGAIPAELANLDNLTHLQFYENRLTGAIPAELGNLANLKTLWFRTSKLSGEIPAELGNLANLTDLRLTTNRLSGDIPAELGNLAKLEILNLGNNDLTGAIPSELGNLAKLETLSLARNELSGAIPSELGNLAKIETLRLDRNLLTGAIPSTLGNLTNLTHLSLYRNQLTGCVPQSLRSGLRPSLLGFSGMTVLELLGLPFCAATTTPTPMPTATPTPSATSAPGATATPTLAAQCSNGAAVPNPRRNAGLVSDCAALLAAKSTLEGARGNLNWAANRAISDWDGVAIANNRVSRLYLYNENLSGAIPAQLGNLANLTELTLHANHLSGAIPAELGNLSNLASLTLGDGDHLSGAIPAELGNLANLRELNIFTSGLSGAIPAELGNLSNLTRLVLMENSLSGEIPSELGNLANLKTLRLEHNNLSGEMPAELGDLANLTRLWLHENQLTGAIPAELGNLSNLTDLDLSFNYLTGCIPQSLRAAARERRYQYSGFTLPFCAATLAATPTPTATSAPRLPRPTLTPTPTTAPRETPVATPTPTLAPGETPVPSPTPTPTPAIVIETTPTPSPTPTATPAIVVSATDDPCIERLSGSGSANGNWASACLSANPPNDENYYARFYIFTLDAASDVTITLSSDAAAPYLYLLDGEGTGGSVNRETGAANASAAAITQTLLPGAYTIEATTYYSETAGDFTLEFEATPAPGGACLESLAGNGSASGGWTSACLSANPPANLTFYARFYTFTLDAAAQVTITLSSADAAPYLYLLDGAGTGGAINRETGAANASAATITATLQPGAYTIEATTYYSETAGDFTLELEIAR